MAATAITIRLRSSNPRERWVPDTVPAYGHHSSREPPTPPGSPLVSGTVFCSHCGTQLAADVRYCPNCGTAVGGSPAAAYPTAAAYQATAAMPDAKDRPPILDTLPASLVLS